MCWLSKKKEVDDLPPFYPHEFETFRKPGWYEADALTCDQPTCFNGNVEIRRYRIRFEEIEESKDILAERLQHLWDHGDNHHQVGPLKGEAKKIGIELKGSYGNRVKKY